MTVELEGVAGELLDVTCSSAPVDGFALAVACGFELRHGGVLEAQLRGSTIYINPKMRLTRQHMAAAHELGHFGLWRHEIQDSEEGADFIAGALLMPRRAMMRDIKRTAWSLERLRELHPNASTTALAVRIVQLREAVMTVIDPRGHKRPWRRMHPALEGYRCFERVSRWEQDLAKQAYAERVEVRGDGLCYAYPLFDDRGTEDRVIVVCDAEQLSARL